MRHLLLLAVVGAGAAAQANISFTFDADAEGWTKGDFGNGYANLQTDTQGAAGWNAAGHLSGNDHGNYAYLFSPDLGGGHGSLFGEDLTFDFFSAVGAAPTDMVVLMSSTDYIVLRANVPGGVTFNNYSFNLSSLSGGYWNSTPYYQGGAAVLATDAQYQSVLNDLRYIGITSDVANGGDNIGIDNVTAVPEPATMAVLGLGAAALMRRKRKA